MSNLQEKEGSVWPQIAMLFADLSISKAVSAAESGDEYEFSVFQRVIHDLFPLKDTSIDIEDNCKFNTKTGVALILLLLLLLGAPSPLRLALL